MDSESVQRVLKLSPESYSISLAASGATREDLDSLLVARLMDLSESENSSFYYLLSCYDSSQTELRAISSRTPAVQQLQEALTAVQELCVSYAGLVLRDLFPQVSYSLAQLKRRLNSTSESTYPDTLLLSSQTRCTKTHSWQQAWHRRLVLHLCPAASWRPCASVLQRMASTISCNQQVHRPPCKLFR